MNLAAAGGMISGIGGLRMRRTLASRIEATIARLRRMMRREPESPEDPYSYVGAPKKPRPPTRSAAATALLD